MNMQGNVGIQAAKQKEAINITCGECGQKVQTEPIFVYHLGKGEYITEVIFYECNHLRGCEPSKIHNSPEELAEQDASKVSFHRGILRWGFWR